MKETEVSIGKILQVRGLEKPDGRPLYAYRVTDAEYEALTSFVVRLVRERRGVPLQPDLAGAFCLYVAETCARADDSWWTFHRVVQGLGVELRQKERDEAIRSGIGFWRRPLHRANRTEYLGTLVAEGGLPVALLQRHGSHLREYLTELLRFRETFPSMDLRAEAERIASTQLPSRLRGVAALASELIAEVARMRSEGIAVENADETRLPLRLDQQPLRELLSGLRDQPRARDMGDRGVRLETVLEREGRDAEDEHAFCLRREWKVARRVPRRWFAYHLERSEESLPQRLYLVELLADGMRRDVALASLDAEDYIVELSDPERALSIVRSDVVSKQIRCVVAAASEDLGSFVPAGGESLGSAPWTFADDAKGRLRSTGTYRSNDAALLVATAYPATDGSAALQVGHISGHARAVYRVDGLAAFRPSDDDDVTTVRASSASEDRQIFRLRGRSAPPLVEEREYWLGMPEVHSHAPDGTSQPVPSTKLRYRLDGARGWSPAPFSLGTGEIGIAEHDDIVWRASVQVLPRDLKISLEIIGGVTRASTKELVGSGRIRIQSQHIAYVGARPDDSQVEAEETRAHDFRITVRCGPSSDLDQPKIVTLVVRSSEASEVEISVPAPFTSIAFVDAHGRSLLTNEHTWLDRLDYLRARVVSPVPIRRAIFVQSEGGGKKQHLCDLREISDGVWEVDLAAQAPRISRLLSSSAELDAEARLSIEQVGGTFLSRGVELLVRRYECLLERDDKRKWVSLPDATRQALSAAENAVLAARAFPLLRPNDDAAIVFLPRMPSGAWSFAGLDPGTWILIVTQHDYPRTRPMRIDLRRSELDTSSDSAVERAMVLPDKVERRRGLSLALREVPLDLDDRAVLAIYAQASASNAFPVTTFDVLGLVVADRPDLAVLCLLFAGARDASRIWKRMENLLFSWVTVPIAAWLSAIEAYLAWLRRHPEFGPVEERAATWASIVFGETKLESFLHVVHDAAYRALKDVPEPRPENFYVYQAGEFPKGYTSLLERASDELNVRHPEDLWLDESPWAESGGARRRDLPDQLSAIVKAQVAFPCAYRGVVVSTPLVLAVRVVQGSSANCDIEALRQVRDFDSEWFDTAFAFALALTLGDRLKKKEFPFHDA